MMNIWAIASVSIIVVLCIFFYFFEKRRLMPEKIVLLAILSAISALGRGLFVAIPSVQPSSFIIIMTGIVLGGEAGFMTGALTALLSGLLLGMGPWTPWQMFAWGMMGLGAGLLHRPLKNHAPLRMLYGGVWGYLYGWIMNVWMLISMDTMHAGWAYIISIYAASFFFDTLHAAANVMLLLLGSGAFLKVLSRMAIKYGLIGKP